MLDIVLMGIRCAALISGGLTENIIITIVLFAIADVVGRAAKFCYIFNVVGLGAVKMILIITKIFGYALPFLMCLIVIRQILSLGTVMDLLLACLMIFANYLLLVCIASGSKDGLSKGLMLAD